MFKSFVPARFLWLVRLDATTRVAAVMQKLLHLSTRTLSIFLLVVVSIGDAVAVDSYWNENNVQTAFSPENRRGSNPVHRAMPAGVRRDALGDAAHAEAAGSGNFVLTVPILNLPGRGQDLRLALTHNSQIWHLDDDGTIVIDPDYGWPAPGWSLGFGKLVRLGIADSAMLVDSDGTRHPFAGTVIYHDSNSTWGPRTFSAHTTDGSLIDYTVELPERTATRDCGINSAIVKYPNGTEVLYGATGEHDCTEIFPTRVTDANGNYISIAYRNGIGPAIDTITDTLGRKVSFHYDANKALTAISGPGLNGGTQVLIRLHYASYGRIDALFYPATSTGYWFGDPDSYSINGLLKTVSERRAMNLTAPSLTEQGTVVSSGTMSRERKYDYPGVAGGHRRIVPTKVPTYSSMVERWSDMDSAAAWTTYSTSRVGTDYKTEITYPDGSRYVLTANGSGFASQTELYNADNKLLRKSAMVWEKGAYDAPRVRRVETTDELGQLTAQEFSYEATENAITDMREYDYGGTNLLRTVHTDYLAEPSYRQRHIFGLASARVIYDGISGSPVSRTEYSYDTEALADTPGVAQHSDTHNPLALLYDAATRYRGNLTQIKRYAHAATQTGLSTEVRQYDIAGNLRAVTGSSCCEQVSSTYTAATQYAYPTSWTRGSSNVNSTDRVTTTASYDFSTGLRLSVTDANGRSLEAEYSQTSLRPVHIRLKTAQQAVFDYEVVYTYDDAALSVTQETLDAHQVPALKRITRRNGLGLTWREQTMRAVGVWDLVDTKYDARGRLSQQSRPYRSGDVPQWQKLTHDGLGRVTSTVAADGSSTARVYNEVRRPMAASAEPGKTLYTVDAWGRNRWSRFDAFDRLVEVLEPKADGSGSVFDAGSLVTRYYYTALDQLQEIQHGVQWSGFVHDSLGRLTHEHSPEKSRTLNEDGTYIGAGTFSDVFTYDARNNLTSHTDARGAKTIYDYNGDALNRLHYISYDMTGFGDTAYPILPADNVSLTYVPTGDLTRLESVVTSNMRQEFTYNAKGLPRSQTVNLAWPANFPLAIEYGYDEFDRMNGIHYPAQHGMTGLAAGSGWVKFGFDLAGRPTDVTNNGSNYASGIVYNANSQVASFISGSGAASLTETFAFDGVTGLLNRQQVTGPGGPLLDLSYDYQRANLNGRTGQATSITDQLDDSRNRSYQYDALGRLTQVVLGKTPTLLQSNGYWTQEYAYDAYGNRTRSKAFGPPRRTGCDILDRGCTPTAIPVELPADRRDGIDGLTYDPQTNHIATAGYAYDALGNTVRAQRADGAWQRLQYDAAGRLAAITDDAGVTLERIMYGAGRQRLARLNGDPDTSSYVNTFYAWSGNQVIAEYTETAAARHALTWTRSHVYLGGRLLATLSPGLRTRGRTVRYHHWDRVGPRLITDVSGQGVAHAPYSFGAEAVNTATGGDTGRFTSYDRSIATGFDYAANRYYDSVLGRFTQVDPIGIHAGNLASPQTLNMYAYVANDPVNVVDPSGLKDAENPSPCLGIPDGTAMGGGGYCFGGVAIFGGDEIVIRGTSITGGRGLSPGDSPGVSTGGGSSGGGSGGNGGTKNSGTENQCAAAQPVYAGPQSDDWTPSAQTQSTVAYFTPSPYDSIFGGLGAIGAATTVPALWVGGSVGVGGSVPVSWLLSGGSYSGHALGGLGASSAGIAGVVGAGVAGFGIGTAYDKFLQWASGGSSFGEQAYGIWEEAQRLGQEIGKFAGRQINPGKKCP